MTKPLSEKQLKSLVRACDRAKARNGNGDAKLGLYIRVAESRIYNGKPVLKALLKEVIYLRMTDLHENDTRIPNGTPWKDYEGWCYAKQEYLANRVGCTPTYPSKALCKIVEDRYLKSREYRGKDGKKHKQYFPDEAFIDAKIAEFNFEALALSARDTSTECKSTKALSANDTSTNSDRHLHSMRAAQAHSASKVCLEGVSEVGSSGVGARATLRSPHAPRGLADSKAVAPLPKQKQNNSNPYGTLSTEAKTKANPEQTKPCPECGSLNPNHISGFDCEEKVTGPTHFDLEEA